MIVGLVGLVLRLHVLLVTLDGIAYVAGCYYVLPTGGSTSNTWYDMVNCELAIFQSFAAILASEVVPDQQVSATELDILLGLDVGLRDHHRWYTYLHAGTVYYPICVFFNYTSMPEELDLDSIFPAYAANR